MPARPRANDTTPRVYEIASDLRSRIDEGEFPVGSKLPSTWQLAEHYDISRQAIARVVTLLKADGVVEGRQGAGVFVRTWRPLVYRPQAEFRRKPPSVDIFTNLLNGEGRDGSQKIEVEGADPEESVRRRLQLAVGERVAVRRRTSYVDGRPFSTDDSYVALHLVEASEWMTEGSVERGTNQVLAELGQELVQALDELYIRMPKPPEVDRLQLAPGTPVGELISTAHNADGQPVQVTRCVLPGDRNLVVYERNKYPRAREEGE